MRTAEDLSRLVLSLGWVRLRLPLAVGHLQLQCWRGRPRLTRYATEVWQSAVRPTNIGEDIVASA